MKEVMEWNDAQTVKSSLVYETQEEDIKRKKDLDERCFSIFRGYCTLRSRISSGVIKSLEGNEKEGEIP